MIQFGKTLRIVRERRGVSVRAAATELGISHPHLSNLENGNAAPSMALLDKFNKVYGVDIPVLAWVLFGEIDKLPPAVREPALALSTAWKKELGEFTDNRQEQ